MVKKVFALIFSLFVLNGHLFSDNIEKTGNTIQLLIPSIAYGTTFYLDDESGRNEFYKSFVTNMAVTYGLKYTINERRPNGNDHSFPSAHTSLSFQSATFIHKRYGLEYAIPAYLASTFVAYSRVEAHEHYTKDVIAGACIGIASSYYFTTEYKGYNISPMISNSLYGISVVKSF
ncbi:MAG: phosphatase PAP2 family protein [Sulfurimonas sp.]|uniref:phosphatase PAP2 family protein n=1 Tax=Sulfurimonas sp. TaxID=2022749 RepID=UPI002628FF7B|nr:phosphatase PAP2 family protein [Sulfurimonas sp.]MDD5400386.1 phosphatase PAP2 family protein [Sulfurimonas sp.]